MVRGMLVVGLRRMMMMLTEGKLNSRLKVYEYGMIHVLGWVTKGWGTVLYMNRGGKVKYPRCSQRA
jgi:hypothetical protein